MTIVFPVYIPIIGTNITRYKITKRLSISSQKLKWKSCFIRFRKIKEIFFIFLVDFNDCYTILKERIKKMK